MTDRVLIRYPTGEVESITARATDEADEWELRSHAFLTPIGPGDIVKVDAEMVVVDLVHLDPQFIYHVDLHLPVDYMAGPLPADHPALIAVERLADAWARDTTITLLTPFSMVVSSRTERWFNEVVVASMYVSDTTMTRTPEVRSVPLEAKPVL